jgi:hypothetical protein
MAKKPSRKTSTAEGGDSSGFTTTGGNSPSVTKEILDQPPVEVETTPAPSLDIKPETHSTEILGFKVEVSRGGNHPRWRTRVDGLLLCFDASLGELRREADKDIEEDSNLTVPEFASVRTAILQGVDYICNIAKAQGLLKVQALRAIELY